MSYQSAVARFLPRTVLSRSTAFGLLAWTLLFTGAASASELSKFLHEVFDEQQGRPPTGAEVYYYSNLYRTDGPLDSYIAMVSSYDYYAFQCQQNPQVYITRLYQLFLRRDPRQDELQFWVNQYLVSGPDRDAFVRQFCRANNVVTVPGVATPTQPTYRPPATPSATTESLVAQVTVLNDMVRRDLGGTRFGQELLARTAGLQSASIQYRDTVNTPTSTPQQRAIAAENVARAFEAVETQFHSVPAVSDPCRNVLWNISSLVTAIRGSNPTPAREPLANSQLEVETNELLGLLRDYATSLSQYQYQAPFYAALNRDVNGLYVQAAGLAQMVRAGQRRDEIERVISSIHTQSREIARRLTNADFSLRQGWWNVQHQLEEVAKSAGSQGDMYVSTNHAVVLNQPGWNQFPTQMSPGYQASNFNRELVGQVDQLITLLDEYVDSLRPVTTRNGNATVMMNQVLDMRHEVLVLRQQAAAGAFGTQLQYASRDLVRQYSEVASPTFARMVSTDATLNSPIWQQIGQLAYQIDKEVRGG